MNTSPFLALGSFSGPEMMIVAVLVLLLFGAKKLPEFARGLGKSMGEFKKARNEFEAEIHRATIEEPQISRPAATVASTPVPVSVPVAAVVAEPSETKPV